MHRNLAAESIAAGSIAAESIAAGSIAAARRGPRERETMAERGHEPSELHVRHPVALLPPTAYLTSYLRARLLNSGF